MVTSNCRNMMVSIMGNGKVLFLMEGGELYSQMDHYLLAHFRIISVLEMIAISYSKKVHTIEVLLPRISYQEKAS